MSRTEPTSAQPPGWGLPSARRYYVAVFVAITLTSSAVAAVYYRSFRNALFHANAHQLELVACLKVEDVQRWRHERLGDALMLTQNPAFARLAERLVRTPEDRAAREDIRSWFAGYVRALRYDRVALLDTHGAQIVSVPHSNTPICNDIGSHVEHVLRTGAPSVHDLHLSVSGGVRFTVIAPVLRGRHAGGSGIGNTIGVVAMRGDPRHYLYPLIARWPTPSRTAETLLTRREGDRVVFLNDLRFRPESALRHTLPLSRTDAPSVMAALGKRGVAAGRDYRGVHVQAYVLPVPDTNWHLTARMDLSEVYEPANKLQSLLASGVILLSAASGLALMTLWDRQRTAALREELAAAKALQEREQRFRTVLESMTDGCQVIGFDQRYVYLNAAALRQHRASVGERVGRLLTECHPGIENTPLHGAIVACLTERTSTEIEIEAKDSPEGRRHCRHSIQPVPEGALVLSVDMTAQRERERELRLHATRMEALAQINQISQRSDDELFDYVLDACKSVTSSPIALIGWVDDAESVLTVQRWSPDVMESCKVDSVPLEFPVQNAGLWAEAVRTRSPLIVNRYADDHPAKRGMPPGHIPVSRVLAVPVLDEMRVVALAMVANKPDPYDEGDIAALQSLAARVREIVVRRRNDVALERSERRFRTLAESMSEGVALHEIIKDASGAPVDYRITYVNPAYSKHTGLQADGVVGRTASEVSAGAPPFLQEYARVAETGEPYEFETYFEPMRRHFRISAVCPAPGTFATVFEDITERKQREQDLADRTAEMERFTYAASHDLRSPLVTVTTFLGYLKEDMASGDTKSALADMNYIMAAADRMGRLLEELLHISRVGRAVSEPSATSFRQIVEGALGAVAGPIAERGVTVHVQDGDVAMFGDVARLVEVWQNLIENAVKFMGDQTSPRIELGFVGAGRATVFHVRDNGMGIAPQHRSRVFGLFDKLDPHSPGTGMGLALVKRIVELHGGSIKIESGTADGGANFVFSLPDAMVPLHEGGRRDSR